MMELRYIQCPLTPEDFHPKHPLGVPWVEPARGGAPRVWGEYFGVYAETVLRAARSLGVPVKPPLRPAETFALEWHFADGVVRTGVCYSDYFYEFENWPEIHGLFKEKHHPDRLFGPKQVDEPHQPWPAKVERAVGDEIIVESLDGHRFPVAAGSFSLAIGTNGGKTRAFLSELPSLRARKDGAQEDGIFHTRRHFNDPWPNGSDRSGGVKGPWQLPHRAAFGRHFETRKNLPPLEYQRAIAETKWFLNVCGNGYSIERKVIEACAIGAAIVSDRGLEDLQLPWGRRFIHGYNILFVDHPEEVEPLIRSQSAEDWRRLVDGSRHLYDNALSDRALGRWYHWNALRWGNLNG